MISYLCPTRKLFLCSHCSPQLLTKKKFCYCNCSSSRNKFFSVLVEHREHQILDLFTNQSTKPKICCSRIIKGHCTVQPNISHHRSKKRLHFDEKNGKYCESGTIYYEHYRYQLAVTPVVPLRIISFI